MERALRAAFWVVFAAAMAVYAVMLAWSLPKLSAMAGGLAPFDMRPGGYSFAQAQALLRALGPDGAAFYRDVQLVLDWFYPALIGTSVVLGIALLTPPVLRRYRWWMASVALPMAPFDYLENVHIARMLDLGAGGITPELVATASRWTWLKSVFSTVAMSLLLLLFAVWAVRRFRGGGPRPASSHGRVGG